MWFDFNTFSWEGFGGSFKKVLSVIGFLEGELGMWVDYGDTLEVIIDESSASFVICNNIYCDGCSGWGVPVFDVATDDFCTIFVGING